MDDKLTLRELSIQWRGTVIHEMAWVEKAIDNYIAYYFTGNDEVRVREMQLFLLGDNRMTLENKSQVLQAIAKEHDLDWINKYQSVRIRDKTNRKSPMCSLFEDMSFCIANRNKFAHLYADTIENDGYIDEDDISLTLYKFKDKTQVVKFSQSDFSELQITIRNVGNYLFNKTIIK